MKVEKVTSPLADGWEYVRRLTARQYNDWLASSKEDTGVGSAIRFVATIVCDLNGKSTWGTIEQAVEEVGSWDWELVRDIDRQACAFNGFAVTVEEATKN